MSKVRFIQISDTHLGATPNSTLWGINTYSAFERLVDAITTLPFTPDFVVHSGDVLDLDPKRFPFNQAEQGYELAWRILSKLGVPIYVVSGNHDSSISMRKIFRFPSNINFFDEATLSYHFSVGKINFLVLDAVLPVETESHGQIRDEHLLKTRELLASSQTPWVIFVHFPPLSFDSHWIKETMLLLNGEKFHQILAPFASRIRGVFLGHIHRSAQILRDGILYVSSPSAFCQFTCWPDQATPGEDKTLSSPFHLVTVSEEETIVKLLTV